MYTPVRNMVYEVSKRLRNQGLNEVLRRISTISDFENTDLRSKVIRLYQSIQLMRKASSNNP